MYLDNPQKIKELIADNYACMKHDASVWHCANCPINVLVESRGGGLARMCADGRAMEAAMEYDSIMMEEGRRIEREEYNEWRANQ